MLLQTSHRMQCLTVKYFICINIKGHCFYLKKILLLLIISNNLHIKGFCVKFKIKLVINIITDEVGILTIP